MSARERARLSNAALAHIRGACETAEDTCATTDARTCTDAIAEDPEGEEEAIAAESRSVLDDDDDDAGNIRPSTDEPSERAKVALMLVHAVHSCTKQGTQRPDALLEAAHEAHARILLEPWAPEWLQHEVALLCEDWWLSRSAGRDSIVSKLVLFLLARSLHTRMRSDVKRVYALRDSLDLFQFEDESIQSLRSLLLRCVTLPSYTKCNEGRRFLSSLFNLHPSLTEHIMATVKNQIPTGSKSALSAYADVLFRAWRNTAGPCLATLEQELQQLGQACISASTAAMASNIRSVLQGFHSKKSIAGVDGLLLRIYEPVLFRALAAANGKARRNAVQVLQEAFPIHDPSASVSDSDALINKQLSELQRLLQDLCPPVRVAATTAASALLDAYWEIIPSSFAGSIISTLADKCARDSSSQQTRRAAIKVRMLCLPFQ